jgi:putative ABC transport system permease protein
MFKILLEEFWGDLRAQKTRALLTMFAVCWGTIAIVLMLSFGEGLKRAVVAGLLGAGERVFIVSGGETTLPIDGLPKGRRIRLVEDDLAAIERLPGVDMVSPSYGRWGAQLVAGPVRTTTMMEGVYPDFQHMRNTYPVTGGRFLNSRDEEMKRRVAFLGDSIATRLFPGETAVGRTLMVDGVPFTVVGTMESKMQSSMNNGPDADRIIIPASVFRTMYGHRYVSQLLVRPRDVREAPAVREAIAETLGRRHRFEPTDERAINVWDFVEEEKLTRRIAVGIQIFLGLVGFLTLLVAGIGVTNIMYVVVRERTREIGIKLAVGARKRHIMAQFVFEAVAISLTGGLIGLLFAAAVVLGVDSLPDTNEAMAFIANPKLPWPIAFGTVGVLTTIGLLAGYFPARRAASLDPVESLRYE